MDTSGVIIEYSEGDFEDAFRALLPKGEYWQDTENQELNNTILGIAKELKLTHDEIELSLLTEFEAQQFGWKVSDYQRLLNTTVGTGSGVVSDDVKSPNLITASLNDSFRHMCEMAWTSFENKRLPHTEIAWIYHSHIDMHHQVANYRHIRNLHKYEVTQ
ncbi:hypothetical protein [Vibrio nigripulchritudo]|uniref:hypothetical protein n=1 Tax=Vibrio nigripulchritudo TaxID=28173 RepID=UPI0024939B70|nr:hypothetical protein [Vibrio nigripulchritudo]BDU38737.1 hypothetical protein TUMSATVNIG2_32060 [Vibrio nigripulchritudo]BDU44457.1 hypothetical protein TUMSATVNIG3_32550 [Vibrio nigripulchritudo]